MGTVITKFLAGGVAGLLAWAVMEPFKPQNITDMEAWSRWEGLFVLLFGTIVGLVVGGYDGYTRGGKVHLLRGLGLGFLFGAVGGVLGYQIGAQITASIFGKGVFSGSPLPEAILARTIVFLPLGAFLGAAIGASSLTFKKIIQGGIGGAIGGGIGGALFDVIGAVMAPAILTAQAQHRGEVGGPSRAIAFTLMGAAIALFIGLVERLTRSAWIRLTFGRNEFKEWSIDSAQTFLGRSEGATIPLMGDPNVQPVHAVIQKQGNTYTLADGGSQIGTLLNGQYIQQAALAPGSIIQIGSFMLQFLVKGTPSQVYVPDLARQRPAGPAPSAPFQQPPVSHGMVAYPVPGAGGSPQQASLGNQTVAYGGAPMQSAMGFSLVALDGPLASQKFPVMGIIEAGREAANIRMAGDANASRRHATIAPSPSGLMITDLNSTNGTFVNGQKITSGEARVGDVVKIGGTSFRVEAG